MINKKLKCKNGNGVGVRESGRGFAWKMEKKQCRNKALRILKGIKKGSRAGAALLFSRRRAGFPKGSYPRTCY
jgi:hypothetical protein